MWAAFFHGMLILEAGPNDRRFLREPSEHSKPPNHILVVEASIPSTSFSTKRKQLTVAASETVTKKAAPSSYSLEIIFLAYREGCSPKHHGGVQH